MKRFHEENWKVTYKLQEKLGKYQQKSFIYNRELSRANSKNNKKHPQNRWRKDKNDKHIEIN